MDQKFNQSVYNTNLQLSQLGYEIHGAKKGIESSLTTQTHCMWSHQVSRSVPYQGRRPLVGTLTEVKKPYPWGPASGWRTQWGTIIEKVKFHFPWLSARNPWWAKAPVRLPGGCGTMLKVDQVLALVCPIPWSQTPYWGVLSEAPWWLWDNAR